MTREQLANILLSDKSKLQEEVMWEDLEYDRFYDVTNIKTKTIVVLNNNECREQYQLNSKWRYKNVLNKKVTIIS